MDDLEFVQSCVKGDKLAWDQFVEKYSRLIYSYIHSAIRLKGAPQVTQDNIAELFQEIFVLLIRDNFKKLKSFEARNGATLATWLRQVTVNFTIDYLRRAKRTVSLDEEDDDAFSLEKVLAGDSAQAADCAEKEEKIGHLKDCIASLDEEERYFVDLHFNQDLPLDKLTEALGASRGSVDMRKRRIIDNLRDCFKSKGFALDF